MLIQRDFEGRRYLHTTSCRIFMKPWAWPYWHRYMNMVIFGAGPIGVMYWPRRLNP